jgi:hypothetical protein
MPRKAQLATTTRCFIAAGMAFLLGAPGLLHAAATPGSISGWDVDGHTVAINAKGHYTVVMYTNPDLEDESRAMTLALDRYRARPDIDFVRVVDLRGDVPPSMRSMVRNQIRKEQAKECARLKKAGIAYSALLAPILPDFSGSTLNALGWDSTYDEVHLVIYDTHGKEIKRLASVTDAKQVTQAVESVL